METSMIRKCMFVGVMATLVAICLPVAARAQRLVFVVRHAERADVGASQMQSQADPPLSAAGEARAARLAWMLGNSGTKAIYVTEFRRTQDTALPLATKLGVKPQQVPSRDTDALIKTLRNEHAEDIVLVVGHSNTVPAVIKAFGGPEVTIADNEYDNLFILVPATGTLTRIRFTP
jgi:broad specificity phosphatase PhoE